MFILLVAVYACIELRELYPKGSDPREALKAWHFMLGLSVFVLVWVRLFARLVTHTPQIIPALATWQLYAAKIGQVCLYLLMICMPIAGWLILSAEGKPVPFWGFTLPSLIAENKALADTIEELHETAGFVGYYLIGLHAFIGLAHHYVRKDDALSRILPNKS